MIAPKTHRPGAGAVSASRVPLTAKAVAMLIEPAIWAALLFRPELPASDRSRVSTERLDELSPIPRPASVQPIRLIHVGSVVQASNEVTVRPTVIEPSPACRTLTRGKPWSRPCSQEPKAQLTPVIDRVIPACDGLK